MVSSELCQIRPFLVDDVPAALTLCRDAGWNQLESDWHRLVRYQPRGCFAAVTDDKLVGTVTTTSYATQLAWIGMMLVDPDHRRGGIATRLMGASIKFLQRTGVRCIKLDATPLGQTVYQQLGFQVETTFHRWQRSVGPASDKMPSPVAADALPTESEQLEEKHYLLDRLAFGLDRRPLLDAFAVDSLIATKGDAFGMLRHGHFAWYLGPVIASGPDDAKAVIASLLEQVAGDVCWDLFDQNQDAAALATALGFRQVRELTRMSLGQASIETKLDMQYAIADPAVG